jgi:CDP-glucose 4,6-dehydratase
LQRNEPIDIRNPKATRPWQHVLEALGGYLLLGAKLLDPVTPKAMRYCEAFNFGPKVESNKRVQELVERIIHCWGSGSWRDVSSSRGLHEASLLSISIDKAYHLLHWYPKLDFNETVRQTVDWYKNLQQDPDRIKEFTVRQIRQYQSGADQPVKEAREDVMTY